MECQYAAGPQNAAGAAAGCAAGRIGISIQRQEPGAGHPRSRPFPGAANPCTLNPCRHAPATRGQQMKKFRFPVSGPLSIGRKTYLAGTDAVHIRKVLRLRHGDRVALFDENGTEYEARIDALTGERVTVSVLSAARPQRESPVRIALAQALIKGKKVDRVVRQLAELGVDAWLPFPAQRSVARPARDKLEARADRWRRIAAEAAKQCRRLKPPEIGPVDDLDAVIAQAEPFDLKIVFWEEAPVAAGWPEPDKPVQSVFLLVGPEGGFTAGEIARVRDTGFVQASLGPRILRAETAAVAVCTLAQHRYGDLGGARKR